MTSVIRISFQLFVALLFLVVLSPQEGVAQQNRAINEGEPYYDFSVFQGLPPFRGIPWGATKEYVLKMDGSPRKETGDQYMVLTGKLNDMDVDISYFFWEGYFIKGTYLTTEILNTYAAYLDKYKYLKAMLSQKYGIPRIDLQNWNDVTYKNRKERWLTAVNNGHLEHFAFWQQERIIISIRFFGYEGRPAIKIEYYIENFESEMNETNDTDILRDL